MLTLRWSQWSFSVSIFWRWMKLFMIQKYYFSIWWVQFSDTTSITPFLTIKIFLTGKSIKTYRNHQPKKPSLYSEKEITVSNEGGGEGRVVYWGVLFYSGWKFWLAIINALLASIFPLLSCWYRLPYFTSLTLNLKLCTFLPCSAASAGCCRNCVPACFWLVILCHLEHVHCLFFAFLTACFFIKNNVQVSHTKHKLMRSCWKKLPCQQPVCIVLLPQGCSPVQEAVRFWEEKGMRCLWPPPQQPPPEGFEMLVPGVRRKLRLLMAMRRCKDGVSTAVSQWESISP